MSPRTAKPSTRSKRVTDAATEDLLSAEHRAVVVDSPPGAGKSTFVVSTAVQLTDEQDQVPVVAQTNAQADDLVRALAARPEELLVGRLTGSSGNTEIERTDDVLVSPKLEDLEDCHVVVGTAAKWGYVAADIEPYECGIVDEAYQMRSDQLIYVGAVLDRALLVGDPGQLDPFSPIDDEQWRGYADGPINPAVATVLHNHPETPVHRLPVSWRLSARCASLVSTAFYPTMPFDAGTALDDRQLVVGGSSDGELSDVIARAAETGWAFHELEERIAPPTDREAVAALAAVTIELLSSGMQVHDSAREPSTSPLDPRRVALGVAHRNQRAAVRIELEQRGRESGVEVGDVVVDTANRLQGREFDVTVVLHPLSGRATASAFHLEAGRLCVLLSRHRHACIVVGRAGIAEVLDAHPSDAPIWLGARLPIPDGWEANQAALEQLRNPG